MDEGIAELRQAWGDRSATASDYVQEPVSTRVPLYVGGSSPAARRRAATAGDGWVPLFLTADEYAEALTDLRRETAEAGRDPESVEAGVVVFACVGEDHDTSERGEAWLSNLYRLPPKAFRRHLVAGPADACAAALGRFAEAGARHILIMVAGSPALEHFGLLRAAWEAAMDQRVLTGVPA